MFGNSQIRRVCDAACVVLGLMFAVPRTIAAETATDLHILLVVDTNASKRGGDLRGGMEANLTHLKAVIDEVYGAQVEKFKDRMFLDILKDEDVSPDRIRTYYRNAKIGPSSSVFFYYGGHGAWDKKLGHYLATSGGDITRNEVRNLINSTRAQSVVMITDCCSSYATFEPPVRRRPAKWKVFHKLFYENVGVVDLTAATESEFAWVNSAEGGFFTRSLVKFLCEPEEAIVDDGPVTWSAFFARVKATTMATFDKAKEGAARDSEIKKAEAQTPYAWRLGGWNDQYTRQLVLTNSSRQRICVWLHFYDRDFASGEWNWYSGANRKALVYEINPGATIRPAYNGFPIEANSVIYWAQTVTGPKMTWGDSTKVKKLVENAYRGPLATHTLTFNP